MAILENGNILTGVGFVVWDGVTRPEEMSNEKGDTLKFSLGFAFPPGMAEYGELHAEAEKERVKKWPAGLPAGANPAFTAVEPSKYPEIPDHVKLNAVTYGAAPAVFDVNGRELSALEYSRALYAGAKVRVIVKPRIYDNKSKGVGFWLGSVQIIDATTPRFAVAGDHVGAAAAAFAAAPVAGVPVAAPGVGTAAPAAPVAPPVAPVAPVAPAAPMAAPVAPAVAVAPNYAAVTAPLPAGAAAPVAPGAAPSPAAPTPPNAPAAPISPSNQMTAAAQHTYEQYIAAGWNDAQLRQSGFML